MAAYDTLRAAIDSYIKANGNKEITGTVLNDILNAMVSALGADTRFAGVAVPTTNPGNPEGNVVYFASQAGTYSNFGGIVLPLGIHILVWNGTVWTSQTWFSVDNTPTQNSQNLATSGGILQAIVDAVGVERLRAIGAEVTSCSFDGTTKKISFFNSADDTLFQLDATAFVIDGMVSDVKIEDGNLVIQFNTDAGKQDIEIPLTDIFNPANYYTKTAIDALLELYYTKTETDALLTAINNKLADGCLYRGMAEPTTNPPTPTTKVFYIATKAGTYTNFGNIAVTEGITILKYDGSNWSKEQISYSDGVFDISAYNGTSYAVLSAALGTDGANIPQNLRKGGMSVKFVQSSDNKYVQYRLMSDSFNTTVANWQGVDDEPIAGSENLVKSGGVSKLILPLCGISSSATGANVQKAGDIYYNTVSNILRRCVQWNTSASDSEYETIPFEHGTLYTYNNSIYIYKDGCLVSNIDNKNILNSGNINKYLYKEKYLLKLGEIGEEPTTVFSDGSNIYKIPCKKGDVIKYSSFISSSNFGCAIIDLNGLIVANYAGDGTVKTILVSDDKAAYFLFCRSASIADTWYFEIEYSGFQNIWANLCGFSNNVKHLSSNILISLTDDNNSEYLYESDKVIVLNDMDTEIHTIVSLGENVYKIPCQKGNIITYTSFISTRDSGCVIIDNNDKVLHNYAGDGEIITFEVEENNAAYFLFTLANSISSNYVLTVKDGVEDLVDYLNCQNAQLNKQIIKIDGKELVMCKYQALGNIGESIRTGSNENIKHSVVYENCDVFLNTETFTFSAMVRYANANNVVTRIQGENFSGEGIFKVRLEAGETAAYISSTDDIRVVGEIDFLHDKIKGSVLTPFINNNNTYVLGAIKTDIVTNKMPFARGLLFHNWINNDLFYGKDFLSIEKIGTVEFSPKNKMLAVSPKDGRIIATSLNSRGSICVWDGETTTELNFSRLTYKPMGWLYNSGVDFIKDGDTEYCIFGEYTSNPIDSRGDNSAPGIYQVWRGTYPYTSESDWEVVFSQKWSSDAAGDVANSITHFHQVRRDPWTNILYLTSGDANSGAESPYDKWWYSEDFGETWTLLARESELNWGVSSCRLIDFIFTKDYIYWATDHNTVDSDKHCLNRIQRDSQTGLIDLQTRVKLCDLPDHQATNSICYCESPNGLFLFDRIDIDFSESSLLVQFWPLNGSQQSDLKTLMTLKFTSPTWGGHRGKCYTNYTNGIEVHPAMGFANDSRCVFDLICNNISNIGTVFYDISGDYSKIHIL